MKLNFSLKQTWILIVLFSIIVPATMISIWFGYQLYTAQLISALQIEQEANEALRIQIEAEINRLKAVFNNKADSLVPLVEKGDAGNVLKEVSRDLNFIIESELAVEEIVILSRNAAVIAAIDPHIGITLQHSLSYQQLQALKSHWGLNNISESPEFIIPLSGRDYISSPKSHDGFTGFIMAVPLGNPAKAVMLSFVNVEKLWSYSARESHGLGEITIRDYLLDRRGVLLTSVPDSNYKAGNLMTHLAITRSALVYEPWQSKQSYIGINNQIVFGTSTTIPSLNWTLVSEVIVSEITHPIWLGLIKVFIFTLLGVALFIWPILYLVRKTLQPIQELSVATERLTQGDYQISIPSSGIQELDVLTANFNLMAKIRKIAEEKLQLSARVFNDTHEGIVITNAQQEIIDINSAFSDITGYSREDIIGKNPNILSSGRQGPEFYQAIWQSIYEANYWQGEVWNRKKDGELYAELLTISALKNEQDEITHYVGIFSDITHSKQQQEKLSLMAHYDILTGLPNRALFVDHFTHAIAHSKRTKHQLAVCFIDLDNFKPVNDNHGHVVGDQLLIEVAKRITANIREEDTVSRQGGDEFILLLNDIESYGQCEVTLERILHALAQPYIIDDSSHNITASIGLTLYPDDNADIDTLIRHADNAMYQAKQSGKHRCHIFDSQHDKQLVQKHHKLYEIQQALLNNEFSLHYQPKVNMVTGEVFGAEALIRWIHPEKGLILPLDFLPLIDGTDLELQLGDWVINQALKQMNAWLVQGLKLEVSVNISSHHLQSDAFFANLEKVLTLYPAVDSAYLQLEVLESSALSDLQAISQIIKTCQEALGVNVSLDDFGTGYSSLAHLRSLTANVIKIDQSFVRDMLDDPSDYTIIDGILGLAESFGREVIAEGVETTEHGLMLQIMGCKEAQGYGIAKPMPADEFPTWLSHYQPNQQWLECGKQARTVKESKLQLFRLICDHWMTFFVSNIHSAPQDITHWPIMDSNYCHCGSWIKRERKEQLFTSESLNRLNDAHDNAHTIAKAIQRQYQQGDVDAARELLTELQSAFDEMSKLLVTI